MFPGFGALGGLTFDVPGQSAAFQSAPLTRPVQVTGSPVIQLRVTGQSAITLFAKLYDVDWVPADRAWLAELAAIVDGQ